jgi:hypothetical protein
MNCKKNILLGYLIGVLIVVVVTVVVVVGKVEVDVVVVDAPMLLQLQTGISLKISHL